MKRATYGAGKVSVGVRDFNPRPREEGDGSANDDGERTRYFNPRPREEGDQAKLTDFRVGFISIHALVKRATSAGRGRK